LHFYDLRHNLFYFPQNAVYNFIFFCSNNTQVFHVPKGYHAVVVVANNLEDRGVQGRMLSKYMLEDQCARIMAGLN
jgi:hypothetical protein